MDVLTTIFYFLVTIGILVFVHELGHFLAAKMCRMRVERFSIGFPPRLIGKKYGDTDYMIGVIPLGGYVKISGMIDESFDTKFSKTEPQPWEFRSKPIYQRIFVITAGVLMNAVLAVLIFWGLNFSQGKFVEKTTEVGAVIPETPAAMAGIEPDDKIVSINNRPISHWGRLHRLVNAEYIAQDLNILVNRDGQEIALTLPAELNIGSPKEHFGLIQKYTAVAINRVMSDSPAEQLGLQPGDKFVSINDIPVKNELDVFNIVSAHPGVKITVEWERDDVLMSGTVTPTDEGLIGIRMSRVYLGPVEHVTYGLFTALPAGIADMIDMLTLLLRSLWLMIVGDLSFSENVGGPIMIAQLASDTAEQGILTFLTFLGLLSITLAFINILPFPILDGGHLMYLLFELIFRREVPAKVQIALQQIGFVIILAFMAFVIYNDITRL